jgi:hypothetical protein
VYYATSPAKFTVIIDNRSASPLAVAGDILFGPRPGPNESFKPLSVTPVTPTTLPAGARARIPLELAFASVGSYELRWNHDGETTTIENVPNSLQCIFAPRVPTSRDLSPWITALPRAAVNTPGLLSDYIAQTSVHRFLIDERFAFDAGANIGLGFGASWAGPGVPGRDIDALLAEARVAKASLILRVSVRASEADPRMLRAFRAYIADACRRAHGTLDGLVISPEDDGSPLTANQREVFRDYYLAGYEAAKHEDKTIQLLGAGSAQSTLELLADMQTYIDATALTDAAAQPVLLGAPDALRQKPSWILPPLLEDPWPLVPPAAALAAGAAVVPLPPPQVDHGVTAHLLGDAVLSQRVHLAAAALGPPNNPARDLPFIAVFQGDRYALAAIAGLSANTPIDASFPALARTRTLVEPVRPDEKPPYPNLEVGDDTHTMRVVDAQGSPIDCRIGDDLYIPLGDQIVYLLQAGTADELAGSLRPANVNRLPVVEIAASPLPRPRRTGILLKVRNITASEIGGRIRLIRPAPNASSPPAVLATADLAPIAPGDSIELPLDLHDPIALPPSVLIELTTTGADAIVQRTAVILPPSTGP